MEFARFLDVVRAFERAQVDYILVGGVAVNLHGIVRATEDIDFFVRPDSANIERVKEALRSLWKDPEIDSIKAEDFGKYPTLRYAPPGEEIIVDILTQIGTAFSYDDLESEPVSVEGVTVRVATPRTLVRMKRDTLRMIDKADAARTGQGFRHRGGRVSLRRFRDFDEARDALWVRPGDPRLLERIRSCWEFARRLVPVAGPRGLRRFRTIEEANQEREEWTFRRAREMRAARGIR